MEDLIALIKENVDTKNPDSFFPLTDIYNEGWLLRLALSKGLLQKELKCKKDEKWFSEAQLMSPFLHGKLRETRTHADAVIGSFKFEDNTTTGVKIDKTNFSFFYAIEAKISAPLSKKINHCDDYNQATRYIGCLAKMAKDAELSDESFKNLGLYVVTPESKSKTVKKEIDKEKISQQLEDRIRNYSKENDLNDFNEWKEWWKERKGVFLNNIKIEHVSWEKIVKVDDKLNVFYQNCLKYNKK